MIYKNFFETRNYEQDSSSHINNANFFRYLEEARVKMMEEKKFPIEDVHKESVQMILYKYICNFKNQIKYPEIILIQSKQISTKKVRGVLRQEIYNAENKLSFEADAYWAYFSEDKSKLNKLVEFASKFGGENVENTKLIESKKFIKDKNHFSTKTLIQVRPYEIDAFQHVNNSVYANYFEMGRWNLRKEILGDINYFKKLGLKSVLTFLEIDFLKPCFNLEELELNTYLVELNQYSVSYYQELKSNDQLKSTSYSICNLIDTENRVSKFDNFSYSKYFSKLF